MARHSGGNDNSCILLLDSVEQEFQQSTRNGLFLLCDVWGLGWGVSKAGLNWLHWQVHLCTAHSCGLDELRRWLLRGTVLPWWPRAARANLCSGQKHALQVPALKVTQSHSTILHLWTESQAHSDLEEGSQTAPSCVGGLKELASMF